MLNKRQILGRDVKVGISPLNHPIVFDGRLLALLFLLFLPSFLILQVIRSEVDVLCCRAGCSLLDWT